MTDSPPRTVGSGLSYPLACPLALCAVLVMASCHRVPARLAETEPEPSGRGSVFVETQTTHDGGVLSPLTSEAAALYSCWFEHPYDYMFGYEGQPLVFDDRQVGMFMAGTHGILYYGN